MSKRKELVDLLSSLSDDEVEAFEGLLKKAVKGHPKNCLLYTSDAADE